MKLVVYSLFNSNCQPFERAAYIRGMYLNARMNNLLYPAMNWITHLEIERAIYMQYKKLFDWLVEFNSLSLHINEERPALCEGMLWRMKPAFTENIDHIICRDSDAITTYKEACAVQYWLESGLPFHAINDNPAHGGLMGGMVGFNTAYLKAVLGVHSWEQLIEGFDLSQRGSDQHLLNQRILPKIEDKLLMHNFASSVRVTRPPYLDEKLWETNLTCRHIGSPGFVDLEVIRQLKRFDPYDWKHQPIEKEFSQLFYWQQ